MHSPVPACASSGAPNPLGCQEGTCSQLCPLGWFSQWFLLWDGSVPGKKGLCCEEPTASPSPRTRPRWVLGLRCCRKCSSPTAAWVVGPGGAGGCAQCSAAPHCPTPTPVQEGWGLYLWLSLLQGFAFPFFPFPCSRQTLCQRSCCSQCVTEHILQVLPRGDTG